MRLPHSLCSMLKLIFSDDSAAEKSFTGMETRPKAICAEAMALGMMEPQKQSLTTVVPNVTAQGSVQS